MTQTAEALRGLMISTALSGTALANTLGKSRGLISRWLSGSRQPSPSDLLKITQEIEMSPDAREKLWRARFPTLARRLKEDGLSQPERLRAYHWVALASIDL